MIRAGSNPGSFAHWIDKQWFYATILVDKLEFVEQLRQAKLVSAEAVAGIITGRKEGKWIHYSINSYGACAARPLLQEMLPPEIKTEEEL